MLSRRPPRVSTAPVCGWPLLAFLIVGLGVVSAHNSTACDDSPEFYFGIENESGVHFGEFFAMFDGFLWREYDLRPDQCCIVGPVPVQLPETIVLRWATEVGGMTACVTGRSVAPLAWEGARREVWLHVLSDRDFSLIWQVVDAKGEPTELGETSWASAEQEER